jgi:thiamine biosynthesis lipoprotein
MRRARPLLGTYVSIAVAGVAERAAAAAIDAAFAAIARVERLMSFHDPGSDLSRLNRAAAHGAVAVDPWTAAVVRTACDLHRATAGCFDITIVPELQRQGLLPGLPAGDGAGGRRRRRSCGITILPGHRLRFHDPAMQIDLGGIAKGFAVDRAIERLRAHGVPAALVEAGGDVAAIGCHAIGIRDPASPGSMLTRLQLADGGMATSAAYFLAERSARARAAIIEPLSGEARAPFASVTVRARSCMIADALTKVVMLRGEGAAAVLAQQAADALVVTHDRQLIASPALHQEACGAL